MSQGPNPFEKIVPKKNPVKASGTETPKRSEENTLNNFLDGDNDDLDQFLISSS